MAEPRCKTLLFPMLFCYLSYNYNYINVIIRSVIIISILITVNFHLRLNHKRNYKFLDVIMYAYSASRMLGLANTRVRRHNEVVLVSKRWRASDVRGSLRLYPSLPPNSKGIKENGATSDHHELFQPWLFHLVIPTPLQLPLLEDSNWYQRHIMLVISLLL